MSLESVFGLDRS